MLTLINGVTWGPYKWLKIHGLFHPLELVGNSMAKNRLVGLVVKKIPPSRHFCRVPKGPGVFKGGGGNWGTLRIPFGKIGEP